MCSWCNTNSFAYINWIEFNCSFCFCKFFWWNDMSDVSQVILWECISSETWCNKCPCTKVRIRVCNWEVTTTFYCKVFGKTNCKDRNVLNKRIINCLDMEVSICRFKDCSWIITNCLISCNSIIIILTGAWIINNKCIIIFLQTNTRKLGNHHWLKSFYFISISKNTTHSINRT